MSEKKKLGEVLQEILAEEDAQIVHPTEEEIALFAFDMADEALRESVNEHVRTCGRCLTLCAEMQAYEEEMEEAEKKDESKDHGNIVTMANKKGKPARGVQLAVLAAVLAAGILIGNSVFQRESAGGLYVATPTQTNSQVRNPELPIVILPQNFAQLGLQFPAVRGEAEDRFTVTFSQADTRETVLSLETYLNDGTFLWISVPRDQLETTRYFIEIVNETSGRTYQYQINIRLD